MAKVENFRFWCQKVLPLVYDDSLSYYELLCKMVTYINNTINAVNENTEDVTQMRSELTDFEQRFITLKQYVDNYFDNLDVQNEINNKLNAMAQSGELTELMKPYIDTMTEGFDERLTQAQNDANLANTRISNIMNLPEGSTTLDAEVADIRVGFNGYTYPSAGDAVREQMEDINWSFKSGFNLFDKRHILNGYYLHGVFEEHEGYWCTPLIYIGYTDKTFVRTNYQTYAITRYDSMKQPIVRSGSTHEWYDRYAVPAMISSYTNAYYVTFAFPDTVSPNDVMITLTDETSGGTENRWNTLFPNLEYQPYMWEINSERVNVQSEGKTLDKFAISVRNEIGLGNEEFFNLFEKTKGINITTDSYTGSKVASFTGLTTGNKTWCTATLGGSPSKAYVLEFMGYSSNTEYSADFTTGAMLVVEFYDGNDTIIGSKYNSYVLGSKRRGFHRYGFVSPYGCTSIHIRFVTRKNTDMAISDISFKEVTSYPQRNRSGVLYDGHLGATFVAPKNTIPAFELGKIAGYSTMITNVNVTQDGVLVALHDDTIDATSDGTGNVRDITYEDLLQYDFGSWFNVAYTNTKIPTFEEVIGYICSAGMKPAVSLHGNLSDAELDAMCDIIKKHTRAGCVIKSFGLPALTYVANKLGNFAEYIYESNSTDTATIDTLIALGVNNIWIEAEAPEVNTSVITYAHNHGVGYSVYFGNDLARVKELIKLGVERFCVDTFSDIVIPLD